MAEIAAPLIVPGVRPGLRVVVSAGAAGIGRAIADAFIAHGAKVVVSDVDEAALSGFRSAHPEHGALHADAGDGAAVERFMGEAIDRLGGLDVLVNNAGIAGPTAPIEAITPEDWQRTIAINLDGMFHHTRHAVPSLKAAAAAHGAAWITNLASVAGRLGFPYRTPYAASKWGVVGLTESLSLELGPRGIRVNALLPGVVEGPRIERVFQGRAQALGITPEEAKAQGLAKVALGGMVTGQDVANMAIVLCSPLGHHIAGQPISVCGHVFAL
ncbi:MAG: SDR family oxidoreductase [Geminicoccaceae bacterium]|nr:MAG: SDR family oxidoreductase [Geminicoccaceae bacterium]